MKHFIFPFLLILTVVNPSISQEYWPNGEAIDQWFAEDGKIDVESLGKQYIVTNYGVVDNDSTLIQTEALQAVIDLAADQGGGVIVIPEGTFLSGSLFFKPNTHLHIQQGGRLKGSNRIKHFPIKTTRMEGQTLNYFCALVNADSLSGFTITGPGTIDGNGHDYWEEFWIRRQYNPQCTNLEAMRPRLLYISNSDNVTIQDVNLVNSPFWTSHYYRCHHVKILDCTIYAPTEGIKAPSSDAIDLDACHDVLVKGCYMHVNDDAVVLKGGKGTYADLDPNNGPTYNIMIRDCNYGTVHGCITFGSESLHDYNVVLRDINVDGANRVIWFKMRPDTPQHYEYFLAENIRGNAKNFIVLLPWTQFYKPEDRPDMPKSRVNNIEIRNIDIECPMMLNMKPSEKYTIDNFTLEGENIVL